VLLADWLVFSVVLGVGGPQWEAPVVSSLILIARFRPSSPAGGLNNRTAMFVLGFVIFGIAVISLVYDLRYMRSWGAEYLLGELIEWVAGFIAGYGLLEMMG
jgi:hypothetical protein